MHEVSCVEIYWFDDTGVGECRVPASWRLLYRDGGEWRPVYTTGKYGVEKDRFNEVVFETVRTDALRIEVEDRVGDATRIAAELKLKLGLSIAVECVPIGSLPRFEGKGRRFVDRR